MNKGRVIIKGDSHLEMLLSKKSRQLTARPTWRSPHWRRALKWYKASRACSDANSKFAAYLTCFQSPAGITSSWQVSYSSCQRHIWSLRFCKQSPSWLFPALLHQVHPRDELGLKTSWGRVHSDSSFYDNKSCSGRDNFYLYYWEIRKVKWQHLISTT